MKNIQNIINSQKCDFFKKKMFSNVGNVYSNIDGGDSSVCCERSRH